MVRMDLASAVRSGTADLICLLPPYVPTSAEALAHAHASASASAVAGTDAGGAHDRLRQFEVSSWTWAGGPLGTALLERFIGGDLLRVLAPRGLALLTVGLLASPDEIVELVSRASRGALVARVAGGGDDHGHKIFCFRVERVS
jgi:methylase of polypeptide subunit release factors